MSEGQSREWPLFGWATVAMALCLAAGALIYYADRFFWQLNLAEIPAVPLAIASLLIGIVFASLAWIIPWTIRASGSQRAGLLYFVLALGLLLRLAMLVSSPALEDDFYRYLWDGGVVSAGYNPYARSPNAVFDVNAPEPLQQLAAESGAVIERVNHPHLKTIYPPVAQFWFAVAHKMQPVELARMAVAWRHRRSRHCFADPAAAAGVWSFPTLVRSLLVEPFGHKGAAELGAYGVSTAADCVACNLSGYSTSLRLGNHSLGFGRRNEALAGHACSVNAQTITAKPCQTAYGPLFIWGNVAGLDRMAAHRWYR